MLAFATWIVVGGASRLVGAAIDQGYGGVTPNEAFKLIATEWGRHVRYFAAEVVRAWEQEGALS
jgi:hypothetical protein